MHRQIQHLMANYDRSVRPSRNAAEPLNITFGLALTQIIDVVSADCKRFFQLSCPALVLSSPPFLFQCQQPLFPPRSWRCLLDGMHYMQCSASAVVADISFFSFLLLHFVRFFFLFYFFLTYTKVATRFCWPGSLFFSPVGESVGHERSRRMLIDSMSPALQPSGFFTRAGPGGWECGVVGASESGGGKSEWMSLTHPPDLWAPAAYAVCSLASGKRSRATVRHILCWWKFVEIHQSLCSADTPDRDGGPLGLVVLYCSWTSQSGSHGGMAGWADEGGGDGRPCEFFRWDETNGVDYITASNVTIYII